MNRLPEIIAELPVAVRAALVQGAQRVAQSAKDRVPEDTGDLERAIHVEIAEDPTDAAVLSGRAVLEGGVYVVAGDDKVFYGHMVEHGTTHSPPHPFLVPALEENRAAIQEEIAAALRKVR